MAGCQVLIVEDSDEDAAALAAHLARYGDENQLLFSVTRVGTAFELVPERIRADLIFMDIDLPGTSGMEVAAELRRGGLDTPLVFVTSLAQYAVQGYQVDALDFMVKPVSYPDFALRMARAMRIVGKRAAGSMVLPTASGMRVVSVADIVYVDLQRHDLLFHVAGESEPLRRRGSISQVAQDLPADRFLPVSQGCLANMGHVRVMRPDALEMDDGAVLYFSRSRKRAAQETLTRYFGGTI